MSIVVLVDMDDAVLSRPFDVDAGVPARMTWYSWRDAVENGARRP